MAYSRLRIFHGAEATRGPHMVAAPTQSTVRLGDILPILAEAQQNRRAWINDFLDDEITISTDLHEVLLAYEHYRRPAK